MTASEASEVSDDGRIEIVITRYVLKSLPIDDESPCGLTAQERDSVAFYMAGELLEEIATSKAFVFVATWRRRAATWPVSGEVVSKVSSSRYGPIAHAVIAHAKNELAKLTESDPSPE